MKDTRVETANEGMTIIIHPPFIYNNELQIHSQRLLTRCLLKALFRFIYGQSH